MNITRETDYAVRCLLFLSQNPGTVSVVDDIARGTGIPKSFLAKILQKLAKAGIVQSTRGVKGGFQLAKRPSKITLLGAIEAVDGPLSLNICVLDKKACSRSGFCAVHPVWKEVQDTVRKKLERYTFGMFVPASAKMPTRRRKKT